MPSTTMNLQQQYNQQYNNNATRNAVPPPLQPNYPNQALLINQPQNPMQSSQKFNSANVYPSQ
jgi:hypothetical protein